ncbi:hypothetical protein SmJEL517_g00609 [Synchytrium microbalum]|uniref:Phosphatidic acid phosphatase type 2/haloperoxidase domain-containing protein n=1 Tax=Synchytrium microbalum TaxID=1806994 RepID=A0A507CEX4_9FUNG|nr:uncharacterized protein SmJEL517_g00609 [Synchytrium microbalum]TPX37739.1 hypothetical protein SmJEL517_g00609 [Synchytrium microbalum]
MPSYTRIPNNDTAYHNVNSSPSPTTTTFPLNVIPSLKRAPSPIRPHNAMDDIELDSAEEGPKRFIRLLGLPKPSADQIIATSGDGSKDVIAPEIVATAITFGGLPTTLLNGEPLVDVLDANNEDPFTLESFESLIKMHAASGKDFVLARVTTADPYDLTKFYYSYYAAHHINKVLFRTQPEEGLLHRMKAKNPLNNMTIVGDVLYYSVKTSAMPSASPKKNGFYNHKNASATSFESIISNTSTTSILQRDSELFRKSKNNRDKSEAVAGPAALTANIRKMFGMPPQQSRRILHLIMRPEALENSVTRTSAVSRPPTRRNSADDAAFLDIPQFGHGSTRQSLDSSRPVSAREDGDGSQEHLHRHVRSIVYSNDSDGLGVVEWVRVQSLLEEGSPTKQRTVGDGMRRRSVSPSRKFAVNGQPRTTTPEIESQPTTFASSQQQSPLYYDARFIGSDDDFLMKSGMRAYFREMALESSDSVLFTIPNSVTVVAANDGAERNGEQHPILPGFAYEVRESTDTAHGWGLIGLNVEVDRKKTLKWLLLTYCVLGFFIVKFVAIVGQGYAMPSSHAQFMAYFAFYLMLHLYSRRHFHYEIWTHLIVLGTFAVAGVVCWSRIALVYHTETQVQLGAAIGSVIGILWYLFGNLWLLPYFIDNLKVLDWRISKFLMIRDTRKHGYADLFHLEHAAVLNHGSSNKKK